MTHSGRTLLYMMALTVLTGGGLIGQTPAGGEGAQALEKLKALEGEWIDVEGVCRTRW